MVKVLQRKETVQNQKHMEATQILEDIVLHILKNRNINASNVQNNHGEFELNQMEGNTSFPIPNLIAVGRQHDLCSWGEWGAYEACTEISVGVCESVRVRDTENTDECGSYNIEVAECHCQDADRLKLPEEKDLEMDVMLCYVNRNKHGGSRIPSTTVSQARLTTRFSRRTIKGLPLADKPRSPAEGSVLLRKQDIKTMLKEVGT